MKPRDRRDRLFRKSRPFVRPFIPDQDMWVLWAAYDLNSFPRLPKMTKQEFAAYVLNVFANKSACLLIEDDCKYFEAGRGPVCFVSLMNNGWKIEPTADFFMWATLRMKLRCLVAFFQQVRYSDAVGICVVTALADSVKLLNRMKRYGVLFPVDRIPDGSPRGDEFIYQVRCKKEHHGI